MKPVGGGLLALALAAAAALPPAVGADERRSGTIVAVDANTVVVEEIGPGRPGLAGNEIERHRIAIDPSTLVIGLVRTPGTAADGWPGGFVETRLGREALAEGAFVTVTLRRDQGQLTAGQVQIVDPGEFPARVPNGAPKLSIIR